MRAGMTRRRRLAAVGLGAGVLLALLAWFFSPLLKEEGYWGPFVLQPPRLFTGDMTPVAHTIRGRTFQIPKAYLPFTDEHRPTSADRHALVHIWAELPGLRPYDADPYEGNGRVLTVDEARHHVEITLSSIVYNRPVSVNYERALEHGDACVPDEVTGMQKCPNSSFGFPIWIEDLNGWKIGVYCGDTNFSTRSLCEARAPLIQNVALNVTFNHTHLPEALRLFLHVADLICGWYAPDPEDVPLTFNNCKE